MIIVWNYSTCVLGFGVYKFIKLPKVEKFRKD